MQQFTVLGIWYQDTAHAVGVVAGNHEVGGPSDHPASDEGCWAQAVSAEDYDEAAKLAEQEMQAEHDAAAEEDKCERCGTWALLDDDFGLCPECVKHNDDRVVL